MNPLWLIPGVVAAAAALTGGLYWYARRYSVLDLPNERSAHTVPTPRGGGIAIVVAFLAAVAWLASGGVIDRAMVESAQSSGELPFPEVNLKQAWRIPSAEAMPNPNGTAPGWFISRRRSARTTWRWAASSTCPR